MLMGVIVGAVLIIMGLVWTPLGECTQSRAIRELDVCLMREPFACIEEIAAECGASISSMPTALIVAGIVVIVAGILIAFKSTGTRNTDG